MKIFGLEITKIKEEINTSDEEKEAGKRVVCDMCGCVEYTTGCLTGFDERGHVHGHHNCPNGQMGNFR